MLKTILKMVMVMALMSSFAVPAFAEEIPSQVTNETPITVIVDGKKVEFSVDPINVDGHVIVQFRPIFEALGMSVYWNAVEEGILTRNKDWEIELSIGGRYARVNGESVKLEVEPTIVLGNTMLPLRFVSEASGKKVT